MPKHHHLLRGAFLLGSKRTRDLPRLILIADQFTLPEIAARVCVAVAAGVRWVHLRDHAATDAAFEEAATSLVDRLKGEGVMISINGRPAVAAGLQLHYHRGSEKPLLEKAEGRLQGYSAHSLEEAEAQAGADYLFYSPIFPTKSKPGHPGVGVAELARVARHTSPQPIYALGGIQSAHCSVCLQAGAYGVAVISGILQADDIEASVHGYLKALNTKAVV